MRDERNKEMFDEDRRRFRGEEEGFGFRGMRRMRCHRPEGEEGFPGFDENDIEDLFMACARRVRHEKHRRFGSTQDRIIRILDENGGTLSQKSLQRLLDVKPGSISEILSKMEDKGLVSRDRSNEDHRASLITLSEEAFDLEKPASFFDVLTEEEKQSLKTILKKAMDRNRRQQEEE